MAEQEVPRRMKRFYREAEGEKRANANGTGANEFGAPSFPTSYPTKGGRAENEGYDSTGRKLLQSIPGMGYEDVQLDQKNFEDLKKIEQKDLEGKIALLEVEKFKKEKKRLPNKEESGQIAENIFTQLKDAPIEEAYPEVVPQKRISDGTSVAMSRREERAARRHGHGEQTNEQGAAQIGQAAVQSPHRGRRGGQQANEQVNESTQMGATTTAAVGPIDIKKLFDEETSGKEKGAGNEFDLGLGDENEDGLEPLEESEGAEKIEKIEDINDFDLKEPATGAVQKCPNCGAQTDKTIYCPKCGTAFCGACAKAKGVGEYTCPKCQTKTKA